MNDPTSEKRNEMRRECYVILPDQYDDGGFIPSLVTEGEPGHAPLTGDPGKHQTPWRWGKTYEEARQACVKINQDTFGLSETECLDIVLSSMKEN